MNEYLSLESIGTFAGMVVAINLIVQFLKPLLDKVKKIPTRYLVWIIAIIVSTAYQAITGTFTAAVIYLLLLNSILLTLTAMGSYEATIKKIVK